MRAYSSPALGHGDMRNAAAMMDFLPRLIPGTLSTRMDTMLAAMRSESNNGYDYLWRVLELYVPGFDPIVPIHPPQWADSNDVFHFAQAYLLFFRLQTPIVLGVVSSSVLSCTPTTPTQ